MSMHKIPLTELEHAGLTAHGLDIGKPSQLSDVFRHGVKWALDNAVPQWIPVSERLPDENYGYFLVVRKYWNEGRPQVCYSFYIKDRDMAKKEHANGYSRKHQGKDSIHFECSRGGFIITHWMPLPAVPDQNK